MAYEELVGLAQQALLLSVALSLPVVVAAMLASAVSAFAQSATRIVDATLSQLPRLLVVAFVLMTFGPWMGKELVAFAVRAFATPS